MHVPTVYSTKAYLQEQQTYQWATHHDQNNKHASQTTTPRRHQYLFPDCLHSPLTNMA